MKILRLKLNTPFRSLPSGFEIVFRNDDEKFEHDLDQPICLVGVNGSGKSNVLEALAEIFSYIDQNFLDFVVEHSDSPLVNSFELEYMLPFTYGRSFIKMDGAVKYGDKYVHIKIEKEEDAKPNFYWVVKGEERLILAEDVKTALPDNIVGYSSGQNELLSIPFYRVRFRYYNDQLAKQKKIYQQAASYNRLRYIDYDENANILLSNYLMSPIDTIPVFKNYLQVEGVAYFQIILNENQRKRGVLKTPTLIQKFIEFLKECATGKEDIAENITKLHFVVTSELKASFQELYSGSDGLYDIFKVLDFQNINAIKKQHIDTLMKSKEEVYEEYEKINFIPNKKLFQISEIHIKKVGVEAPINYRNLSDGEHQFIHIIGMLLIMKQKNVLFLLDEPETHFNPRWKYEYSEIFKTVMDETKSQIILTTHDPVLLSGLAKENVIIFNKSRGDGERIYKPDEDLKGMGVDAILTSEIFGMNTTLDKETMLEMVELRTLQLTQLQRELTPNESEKYLNLYEKLRLIDFAKPLNDPMYRDFLLAQESLNTYSQPFFSPEEKAERERIAKLTLDEVKSKTYK